MHDIAAQPTTSFAERARPAPLSTKELLVDALADRFYVNQQGVLISNGLSTDLICFPGDLNPKNKDFLARRVDSAIQYATNFNDIDELNALSKMPPRKLSNPYTALGLYLYLADECSRLKPDTTFLSAMREAGAKLSPDEQTYIPEALLSKTMDALKLLGMDQSHGHVLKEWAEKGTFTVEGQLNGCIHKKVIGAYSRLARDISLQQQYLGMNLPISYALGIKEIISKMNQSDAYHFTDSLTKTEPSHPPHPYITAAIEHGDILRREHMHSIIESNLRPEWEKIERDRHNHYNQPALANMAADKFVKNILRQLPEAILEIVYREDHNYSLADAANIKSVFPKEDLPGKSHENCEYNRGNAGLNLGRYHTLLLSHGDREVPNDIQSDPQLYSMVIRQTLMHEQTHIAISNLSEQEKQPLKKAVKALQAEIKAKAGTASLPEYFNTKLKTICTNTLQQVLDRNSKFYTGYDEKNKWEEIVCNVSSLMHSEFPYPPDKDKPNPYGDLETLASLAEKINEALELAAVRCREKFPMVQMPALLQGSDIALNA